MSPLHIAVATGSAAKVKAALGQKPDVNERSVPNGFTPLHINVSGLADDDDRQEIIKLLHSAGASLEARTYDKGLSPLQHAALRNRPRCIATLIACGADVKALEGNGATALHGAAFHGHTEVVKVLLAAGADPILPDKHGHTPLSLAMAKGHTDICALLQATAGTCAPLEGNFGELIEAAESGDIAAAKSAIDAGADVNCKSEDGWTPLLSASKDHPTIVQLLLANGADPNVASDRGYTPLMRAAGNGREEIVRLLLAAGADKSVVDCDGKAAYRLAIEMGQRRCARMVQ